MASGFQLSGLASGFDWKSFTDNIIQLERAPATRLESEQNKNSLEKSTLSDLGAKLSTLQSAVKLLSSSSVGVDRIAVNQSASGKVSASVSSQTPVGTYAIRVSNSATACTVTGGDISSIAGSTSGGELKIKVGEKDEVTISVSAGSSVAQIVASINSSGCGVSAVTNGERIVLRSQYVGAANSIAVNGAMADALKLTGVGVSREEGRDAIFSINGLTFSSEDDVLDEKDHGVPGLILSAPPEGVSSDEVIKVSDDRYSLRKLIDDFVASYNDVATFVANKTAISTSGGKTTAGPLASNREVQMWLSELRSKIFNAPPSPSGKIKNISSLGLDFSSDDDKIKITDSAKLDAVLAANSSDVVGFFRSDSVGLASSVLVRLNSVLGEDGAAGLLKTKLDSYDKANLRLDDQIAALDRYLQQRRSQLEASFIAMESAQSKMSQMQTMLTNQFGQKK
jgi:flagellar hook-associated protein 2